MAIAANTCQMCGGTGTKRGSDESCYQCGGKGEIPRAIRAAAEALVATWPPFTSEQAENIRRIFRRHLSPAPATQSRRAAA